MKKKLIIKESELEQFVKNALTENQLEIDFPVEKDALTEMLEEKYQELLEELKSAFDYDDVDSMEEIYDNKIFDLMKNLHKVPSNMKIVDKFNELEDTLIDYIEIHKQYSILKKELEESADNLNDLFRDIPNL